MVWDRLFFAYIVDQHVSYVGSTRSDDGCGGGDYSDGGGGGGDS